MVVWSATRLRSTSSSSTSRSESEYRRYQRTAHRMNTGSVCPPLKIAGRGAFSTIAPAYQHPTPNVATHPFRQPPCVPRNSETRRPLVSYLSAFPKTRIPPHGHCLAGQDQGKFGMFLVDQYVPFHTCHHGRHDQHRRAALVIPLVAEGSGGFI